MLKGKDILAGNIRIAEFVGWTHGFIQYGFCGGSVLEYVWFPPGQGMPQTARWIYIFGKLDDPPSFFSSLDNMRSAELILQAKYPQHLYPDLEYERLVFEEMARDGEENQMSISASASQRARALLRVIDKIQSHDRRKSQ